MDLVAHVTSTDVLSQNQQALSEHVIRTQHQKDQKAMLPEEKGGLNPPPNAPQPGTEGGAGGVL